MSYSTQEAYEMLAQALDKVASHDRELLLAKVALMLAEDIEDLNALATAISISCENLEPPKQ